MKFNSLPQFYNSKEWRGFRQGLIQERTNKADGKIKNLNNLKRGGFSQSPLTMEVLWKHSK